MIRQSSQDALGVLLMASCGKHGQREERAERNGVIVSLRLRSYPTSLRVVESAHMKAHSLFGARGPGGRRCSDQRGSSQRHRPPVPLVPWGKALDAGTIWFLTLTFCWERIGIHYTVNPEGLQPAFAWARS